MIATNKLKNSFSLLKNEYIKVFLYGILIAACFIVPFIILDQGYFLYYGDFNVQEIPFYRLVHDAIRSGNIFWSWETDLGANFIGSYSFYFLGSPFFWITLPFPSHVIPYLIGPILILKFGFAALTSYLYLQRYVLNKNFAIIGAILYAFSGFSIYNIFFFHFHEAIIVFPLVLYALDEFMYKKRRGIFALTVGLSALMNYYFFVGQVVFIIIYWFVRCLCGSWRINFKQFLYLLFEAIIGFLLSAFLLLPAILSVFQNPRTNNFPKGFEALLYSHEQRYLHIIESFFFPPDIPARPNFTPGSEAKWSSVAAWFPLFSMTGVIALMKIKKKSWLKKLLVILFFMSMIPVLNSIFQLFNMTFYTRWFYMLTLMMGLATTLSLERKDANWSRSTLWTFFITLSIALPIAFMPSVIKNGGHEKIKIGLMQYKDRFWVYVAVSIISLLILFFIIKIKDRNSQRFFYSCILSLFSIIIISSTYIVYVGKSQSYDTKGFIIPYSLNHGKDINLPDVKNCRCDVYNGMDNQAMFWQIPTIQAFHSIVPGSIMEFYPSIGVTRDVGSRPDTNKYGLRSFASCRWLFDYQDNKGKFKDNTMPGWTYYDNQNGFDIWENQYYIPFGFSYDSYLNKEQYNNIETNSRHLALLKAIVLEDNSIGRNSDILDPVLSIMNFNYTFDDYFMDCERRKSLTCYDFKKDSNGFDAKIDVPQGKDRLVFFSVPYESGWSASVNDKPVKIEKANIGFMAVRVPAGQTSDIRFNYMTPGLIYGILISLLAAFVFILYYIFIVKKDVNNKFRARRVYKIKSIF